jgi:hypothetical protein
MKKAVCRNCENFGKKGCSYPKEVDFNDAACAAYVEGQKTNGVEDESVIYYKGSVSKQGW